MFNGFKVDLNEISFYLWIAVGSLVFSIFSLKYNTDFIYMGFVTFAFGIIGHISIKRLDSLKNNKYTVGIIESILLLIWIYFCFRLLSV